MKRKSNDFYCGLVCLLVAAAYLLASLQIGQSKVSNTFPPNTLPLLFGGLLALLSLILIIRSARAPARQKDEQEDAGVRRRRAISVALCIADFFLCWLLMQTAGFVVAIFVFLEVLLFLLTPKERRSWWKLTLLSLIVTLGVYLLFLHAFHLILPRGVLGTLLG
ncbi:MAG: tripartite tricarboxylate transporter TctB family protein [Oscillospiraceae bacterium]|nr:tripartite tricarboxylate transporter TctB family protein [Oscillospiraceae bacterium]